MADLDRIAACFASDKPVAAEQFVRAITQAVDHLKDLPLLGRVGAYQDTRELVVHRNYLVTYRARAEQVQVLQIWHVARDRPRGPV